MTNLFGVLFVGLLFIVGAPTQEIRDELGATVIDTLLAMTIFRTDFDNNFFGMLVALLFLKFFHWAARLRTDYVRAMRAPKARSLALA